MQWKSFKREVIIIDKGKIVLNGMTDKLREEKDASIDGIFRRVVR